LKPLRGKGLEDKNEEVNGDEADRDDGKPGGGIVVTQGDEHVSSEAPGGPK
jgi:hypothetical protein